MKTNYEKQAKDFLEKTGCKMEITFKEERKYFSDDKEARCSLRCGKGAINRKGSN